MNQRDPSFEKTRMVPKISVKFPELKPVCDLPAPLSWVFQDGPDFYIYRAIHPVDSSTRIGLYFGHFPGHHRPRPTGTLPGIVASTPIIWNVNDPDFRLGLFRETIFVYPPHSRLPGLTAPLKIHVWINADSVDSMNELTTALENLKFQELDTREQHKD